VNPKQKKEGVTLYRRKRGGRRVISRPKKQQEGKRDITRPGGERRAVRVKEGKPKKGAPWDSQAGGCRGKKGRSSPPKKSFASVEGRSVSHPSRMKMTRTLREKKGQRIHLIGKNRPGIARERRSPSRPRKRDLPPSEKKKK